MKRAVKFGAVPMPVLGTLLLLGTAAQAGKPYLPLIGPAPLRVQTIKSPAASVIKFETAAALAATNSPPDNAAKAAPAADAAANPVATNLTAATFVGPVWPAAAGPPVTENSEDFLGETFSASVFAMPTPDLLGITPQMLAAYFHPVQKGTNAAVLLGPFHVSFVPPLPPDKSSHAEYKVK